ncbi:biopolymer transporter ExbD [uncultured Nevskia sp.]|uniref:ExbD/TolR family protein n=1 Tax=uncultured Nevskia sp. TaxID=228950 RepID=UPI0025E746AA|nr:biopolymer transporter ExbD [uncultured Nevskia sp.]
MAFGSFGGGARNSAPMAEINVIPLVDIMLVLLVIFIITAPLLTHAVKIDLPKADSTTNVQQADNIQFAIDADSQRWWNGEKVDEAQTIERLRAAGAQTPSPELHLRVDRNARYEIIATVMSEAAKAGVTKVGFVTDPSGAPLASVTPVSTSTSTAKPASP